MTDTYTQAQRPIGVQTPFGADVLLLNSFSGSEGISQLFHYDLQMSSPEKDLDPKKIIGKPITFWVLHEDGEPQYFNGIVNRFAYAGTDDRLSYYRAEVVPILWLLTQRSDCRIFQKKSIPDIIKDVTAGVPSSFKITGVNDPWDYCVQYRETDFNFISRLMEQEGIFYFFRHSNGNHEMVISNEKSVYKEVKDKEARFSASIDDPEIDNLSSWEHQYEFRSGKWTHTDYNFETPSINLATTIDTIVQLNATAKQEIYDFPGEYEKKPDGERYVRIRMEEEETAHNIVHGAGSCRSFTPGGKFKLKTHASDAEKGKGYVITSVRHSVSVGDTYVSGGSEGVNYSNTFTCIPDTILFRPPRVTPRPIIQGIQTAVVVGPAGEEIYTDDDGFGRIKVQFHWDRLGKKNENSSCWIRVATPWAGMKWGMIHIPRIGQEVIVQFLEGDPDRPLIIGSVYNKEQMPPYTLPDNKTQSGVKSRSSLHGGEANFNEIRFEDKKGSEQLYIHAEKNEDIIVENNKTESVGANETITIGNDRKETVGHDETITVKNDRVETVVGNETLTVEKTRTRTVQKHEVCTVYLTRTHSVGINEMINVGGAQEITVIGAQTISVGGAQALTVGAVQAITVIGKQTNSVRSDRNTTIKGEDTLSVGKKLSIEAADEIVLKTGSASITMKKDGTIEITGKDIKIDGSSSVKAGAAKIEIEATGSTTVKGMPVELNP